MAETLRDKIQQIRKTEHDLGELDLIEAKEHLLEALEGVGDSRERLNESRRASERAQGHFERRDSAAFQEIADKPHG